MRYLPPAGIEQQSYRSCMGLLKLAEKHSPEKLEQACATALSYSGKPSYKSIKNLLVAAKDEPDTGSESSQAVKPHGITRGARYYGGKQLRSILKVLTQLKTSL